MLKSEQADFSVALRCQLLGLPRSSYYYRAAVDTEENLRYVCGSLMNNIC